jgi:hypothetical protein
MMPLFESGVLADVTSDDPVPVTPIALYVRTITRMVRRAGPPGNARAMNARRMVVEQLTENQEVGVRVRG